MLRAKRTSFFLCMLILLEVNLFFMSRKAGLMVSLNKQQNISLILKSLTKRWYWIRSKYVINFIHSHCVILTYYTCLQVNYEKFTPFESIDLPRHTIIHRARKVIHYLILNCRRNIPHNYTTLVTHIDAIRIFPTLEYHYA